MDMGSSSGTEAYSLIMTPQHLENIHSIIVHCSATQEDRWVDADDIARMHRARGWATIGYHRVIRLDGSVEQGREFTRRGAHVKGNNINTIGICLIGGISKKRRPKNTFKSSQFHALMAEIMYIKRLCTNLKYVKGHRDYSPDLNGDGLITPDEWIKQCPCFSVAQKMSDWRIEGLSW